jgi:hypothetical protein
MNYDIDTLDWQGNYTAAELNFVNPLHATTPAKSSFVSLAHDIHNQTVTQLVPYMIQQAQQLGYQFTTVGECLGDPVSNWYRDPVTGGPVQDPLATMSAKASGGNATQISSPTSKGGGNFGDASIPTATSSTTSTTASASAKATPKKSGVGKQVIVGDARHFSLLVGLICLLML